MGLNGSGKSTLLRIMAGIDTDIDGEAQAQQGLKVGYLPQEPVLDESKTVREIVVKKRFLMLQMHLSVSMWLCATLNQMQISRCSC